MAYDWSEHGIELEFFAPGEFDHPELMDPTFLKDLDDLRRRCGFPIRINDDARTLEEHELLYAKEIAKGLSYPKDSAHLYRDGTPLVRAVDAEPAPPRRDDGSPLTLDERELKFTREILRFWESGRWRFLGLGIETGHWHFDDTPRLWRRRPAFWVAASR